MKRLEVKYILSRPSLIYAKESVSWRNAELNFQKDGEIIVKLWEDEVELEAISENWSILKERWKSLYMAVKYGGDHTVRGIGSEDALYRFDDKKFTVKNEKDIAFIIDLLRNGKGEYKEPFASLLVYWTEVNPPDTTPVLLPATMPAIPADLHWMSETLATAEQLEKYPDLVLKLAYIVLDELDTAPPAPLLAVRNFVSHKYCDRDSVINFIEAHFPSAVISKKNDKGKNCVQFRRNDKSHMAFVRDYSNQALQRARELFEEAVITAGGTLLR